MRNKDNIKFILSSLLLILPLLSEEVAKRPSLGWISAGLGSVMALLTDPRGVFLVRNIINFLFPKKIAVEEINVSKQSIKGKQIYDERVESGRLLRAEKALKTVHPGSISVGDKIPVLPLEKFLYAVNSAIRLMEDDLDSKLKKVREEWVPNFLNEIANQSRREYPQEIVDLDINRLKIADQKMDHENPSPLDGKVNGTLFKNKDGQRIPADEFVVFRPQDDAFFAILPAYLSACKNLGADDAQIDAVRHLINKIADWRKNHPERCKTPDCQPGETPQGW